MEGHAEGNFYSSNNFLVTGGAGFIGSNLVSHLLEQGAQNVRVLDNFSTGFKENLGTHQGAENLEIIDGDIRDLEICKTATQTIDVVLHQAALGSVPRSIKDPLTSYDVNVNGFMNMIHSSMESGIKRFVYASSSSVYGDHPDLPKVEAKIGTPLSPYALTKSMNEQIARVYFEAYGFSSTGLRYFNVFGPRQSPKGPYAAVIPLFIQGIRNNVAPTINGNGTQTRDFTFIENAIEANIKAAFYSNEGSLALNVACGESFSVLELYNILKEELGSELDPNFGPERKGDVRDSLADIRLATESISYTGRVKFREGLKRTLEYQDI